MIFDYWNSHLDEFLDLLRQQQYCDTVVREHKRMAKLLMDEADNNSWQSYDEVRNLLAEPDTSRKTGIRDLALMVVLYATAARIDEILSIRIQDLHLDVDKPYVVIIGKGDKMRTLYLLPKAVAHIKLYMKVFHGVNPLPTAYLFYSRNKGLHEKLSQSAIRKMLKKYADQCHSKCEDVP